MRTNQEILDLLAEHKPFWNSLGFGYEDPANAVRYFCTPENAQIFASLGVDGIHYCTIPSFGEYVFVVNPMPAEDKYVMPAAENLEMFMNLVFSLQGTQLIDQLIEWTKEQFLSAFHEHLSNRDNKRTSELSELGTIFSAVPIEDPYDYIHKLGAHFPPSIIPYTSEYYETLGITPKPLRNDDFFSIIKKTFKKD